MAKEKPKEPLGTGEPASEPAKTDWKAEARKWETRAKANADKAKAYDEEQEAGKSELQKAIEQANAYKAEADSLKTKAALDAARSKVSEETGVPASLIKGEDEDSMREFAKAVADFAKPKTAPKMPKAGKFDASGAGDEDSGRRKLAKMMFGND